MKVWEVNYIERKVLVFCVEAETHEEAEDAGVARYENGDAPDKTFPIDTEGPEIFEEGVTAA